VVVFKRLLTSLNATYKSLCLYNLMRDYKDKEY
jgi:hypothetical protein